MYFYFLLPLFTRILLLAPATEKLESIDLFTAVVEIFWLVVFWVSQLFIYLFAHTITCLEDQSRSGKISLTTKVLTM